LVAAQKENKVSQLQLINISHVHNADQQIQLLYL